MYKVSNEYHSLIASGAEQNLLIMFDDMYFSGLDRDFEQSGATLNEYFCTSTDVEVGEVASSMFSVNLMNLDGNLSTVRFGEGRPYIGVKRGTGTYRKPDNAACYTQFPSSDGMTMHTVIGYSDRLNIDGTDFSTDGKPVNIVWAYSDYVYVQTSDAMYEYQLGEGASQWTISKGDLNPHMASKESEGVSFFDNILIRYLENGTTETWEYCPLGVFQFQMPTKRQTPIVEVTALDRMSLFDKDATEWLQQSWTYPITLQDMFISLCNYVGVPYALDVDTLESVYIPQTKTLSIFSDTLTSDYNETSKTLTVGGIDHSYSASRKRLTLSQGATSGFTNGDMSFTAFPTFQEGATCRDILAYIAEAAGSIASFDRDGNLRMKWFPVLPTTEVDEHNIPMDGYDLAEYTCPKVEQLIAKMADGNVYSVGGGDNVYTILGNSFLASDSERVEPVFEKIQSVGDYIPVVADVILADPSVEAGDRVLMLEREIPLMSQTLTWSSLTRGQYVATGNPLREIPSSDARFDFAVMYNNSKTEAAINNVVVSMSSDESGFMQNINAKINAAAQEGKDAQDNLDEYASKNADGMASAKTLSGHIKYGVVGYEDDGTPIVGIAIGQEITVTGETADELPIVETRNLGVYTATGVKLYAENANTPVAEFTSLGTNTTGYFTLEKKWRWVVDSNNNLQHKYIG